MNTHNMPPKGKSKPRRGARKGQRKGAKVALPKRITGNFASRTEQFSVAVTAGVVNDFTFNMRDLVMTRALMAVYQYYRITSVEMRFKPYFDTFANGLSSGQTLPYLYFQYDKSGALSGLTAQGFEDIGTKAIRMDDKTIVRKWKPSVITNSTDAVGVTQFKVAPWLPTQFVNTPNDDVDHYGAIFYISKTSPTDATVYDVDVVVNVQYRKPLVVMSQSETPNINPPRIKQGNMTQVDLSLNPHLVTPS